MGHHDQGGLLGSGTLARAQQDGIEVQAPCGGGGGRVRAQQGRVRALLPPVLTVLGVLLLRGGLQGADAPADAGHGGCVLQAHPLHLRLLARAGQDSDSLRGEKLQCQRPGGWGSLWGRGRHRTSVGGQLGVENLATRRSRSMVRTDQLPWGAPGEDGRLRAAGRTSPSPSTAQHGTHRLSERSWHPSVCPPQTRPRGRRAESSRAPPRPRHVSPCPRVPLPAGCAGPCPAQASGCRPPSTAPAGRCSRCRGRCLRGERCGSAPPAPHLPRAPRGAVLTPRLPRDGLQHGAGLLGVPVVLRDTRAGGALSGPILPTSPL